MAYIIRIDKMRKSESRTGARSAPLPLPFRLIFLGVNFECKIRIHHNYKLGWYGMAVLRSAKRTLANVRRLNNSSDVIFYCSVGERSRALSLLNAAQI